MTKARVKPVDDRRITIPRTGAVLPASGAEVELSSYWLRRIEEGDVVMCGTVASVPSSKEVSK